MSEMVLIALGSNLPDQTDRSPLELCRWAIQTMAATPDLHLESVSDWYRTRPVPVSDQPDYINGVARLISARHPCQLLERLHAIEAEAGRVRSLPNAARVLDLDLLAVGDRIVHSLHLSLPHPRLQDRAFVLRPLCDVAPDWRHPVFGRTAAELLAALPAQETQRLDV